MCPCHLIERWIFLDEDRAHTYAFIQTFLLGLWLDPRCCGGSNLSKSVGTAVSDFPCLPQVLFCPFYFPITGNELRVGWGIVIFTLQNK